MATTTKTQLSRNNRRHQIKERTKKLKKIWQEGCGWNWRIWIRRRGHGKNQVEIFKLDHLIVIQGKRDEKFAETLNNKIFFKRWLNFFTKKWMWWIRLYVGDMMRPWKAFAFNCKPLCSPSTLNASSHCCVGFEFGWYIKNISRPREFKFSFLSSKVFTLPLNTNPSHVFRPT